MDEGLNQPPAAAVRPPLGIAVRYCPGDDPGLWHETVDLPGGRLGLAVGRGTEPGRTARLRTAVRDAFRDSADPRRILGLATSGPADGTRTALCGVIDRAESVIAYASLGGTAPAIATPDTRYRVLDAAPEGVDGVALPPGATVLLCTALPPGAASLLDGCTMAHPEHAADHLIGNLPSDPPLVALFYRHPPAPLDLTVPAEPASLVTVRSRLRQWLALVGVDAEPSADALLAVGEAASNAAEHAVTAVPRDVHMRVRASVQGNRLRFTVSDDGTWKAPAATPSPRGHGLRLINALVDAVDLHTTDQGTTVEMHKEVHR